MKVLCVCLQFSGFLEELWNLLLLCFLFCFFFFYVLAESERKGNKFWACHGWGCDCCLVCDRKWEGE